MNGFSLLSPEELLFYRTTLYKLIQDGPIGQRPGAEMMRTLRKEIIQSQENSEFQEYTAVVGELYKVVTDSLVSAAHRSAPHELINRSCGDYHVATDEEEYHFHQDNGYFDLDEEDAETDTNSDMKSNAKDSDPKQQRKREEVKKRRREEERLLLNEKKVIDDKGRHYHTIGPHTPPRLTIRTTVNTFPSRKALQHRTVAQLSSSSSSSESEEEEEEAPLVATSSSEGREAVNHLTDFLKPLSFDSLKKVGESAKAKLRPSSPHDEFVSQIVKTAVRLGCEKACVLMDKQKIIEDMTSHVQAGPLPTTASIDYLKTLPENLKQSLGSVLGLPDEKPHVEDMWERMVAMGFLSVLTNLRLKPLKKIATELTIKVPDSNSTEKFCEAVVFAAFPRERIRARFSRAKTKKVSFTVPPESMYVKGDMGFISFQVNNISMILKESERHYSPEFFYGGLKWSLLCMGTRDSDTLALYLCQTGSVHCKFLLTVVNQLNPDDSICNEGTQSFSSASNDNDWGFNSVMRLTDLLSPSQGFLAPDSDSISIEVGIVLVEPVKSNPVKPVKEKKNSPFVDEAALRELLEDEKAESLRKKIKQDMAKTLKDEDKTRKELVQKSLKTFHDLLERSRQEAKRIVKEMADREKREEQERQRELEKIKHAQEQHEEMKRKLGELKQESTSITQERQQLTQDTKDVKKANEKMTQELKSLSDRVQAATQKLKTQEKKLETATKKFLALQEEEPPTPSPSDDDENDLIHADLTRIIDELKNSGDL